MSKCINKKLVTLYFGIKSTSVFGMDIADTIKFVCNNFNAEEFLGSATNGATNIQSWKVLNTNKGEKYINISNLLWFEVEDYEGEKE